jgi:hypothetical protein
LHSTEILNSRGKAGKQRVTLIQNVEIVLEERNENKFERSSEVFLVNNFPVDQRSKARKFLRNLREDKAGSRPRRENESHAQVQDRKSNYHQMCGTCLFEIIEGSLWLGLTSLVT